MNVYSCNYIVTITIRVFECLFPTECKNNHCFHNLWSRACTGREKNVIATSPNDSVRDFLMEVIYRVWTSQPPLDVLRLWVGFGVSRFQG